MLNYILLNFILCYNMLCYTVLHSVIPYGELALTYRRLQQVGTWMQENNCSPFFLSWGWRTFVLKLVGFYCRSGLHPRM